MTFLAAFVIGTDLYAVTDNHEIWRWDPDEGRWVKCGEIERD